MYSPERSFTFWQNNAWHLLLFLIGRMLIAGNACQENVSNLLWLLTWCLTSAPLPTLGTLAKHRGGHLGSLLPKLGCHSWNHVILEFGLFWYHSYSIAPTWIHISWPFLQCCFSFSRNHFTLYTSWALSSPYLLPWFQCMQHFLQSGALPSPYRLLPEHGNCLTDAYSYWCLFLVELWLNFSGALFIASSTQSQQSQNTDCKINTANNRSEPKGVGNAFMNDFSSSPFWMNEKHAVSNTSSGGWIGETFLLLLLSHCHSISLSAAASMANACFLAAMIINAVDGMIFQIAYWQAISSCTSLSSLSLVNNSK